MVQLEVGGGGGGLAHGADDVWAVWRSNESYERWNDQINTVRVSLHYRNRNRNTLFTIQCVSAH